MKVMCSEEFEIQLLEECDAINIYTIHRIGAPWSEFHQFLINHKDNPEIGDDFYRIIRWIEKIEEHGALERYFRTAESKYRDRVCALPVESGRIRLYVLRVSDQVLILGNGGIKTTRTYNEDPVLLKCVTVLAAIDRQLCDKVHIVGKELVGIESAVFRIK